MTYLSEVMQTHRVKGEDMAEVFHPGDRVKVEGSCPRVEIRGKYGKIVEKDFHGVYLVKMDKPIPIGSKGGDRQTFSVHRTFLKPLKPQPLTPLKEKQRVKIIDSARPGLVGATGTVAFLRSASDVYGIELDRPFDELGTTYYIRDFTRELLEPLPDEQYPSLRPGDEVTIKGIVDEVKPGAVLVKIGHQDRIFHPTQTVAFTVTKPAPPPEPQEVGATVHTDVSAVNPRFWVRVANSPDEERPWCSHTGLHFSWQEIVLAAKRMNRRLFLVQGSVEVELR